MKTCIHLLYLLNPTQGCWGGWSLSQLSLGERQGTPWTGRQSITGPHRDEQSSTLTLSPRVYLESPINLSCMFWGVGRETEYSERTHAYTGRTCKLHTERPQPGFEPGTLLLWGDSAHHCAAWYENKIPEYAWIRQKYDNGALTLQLWLSKWMPLTVLADRAVQSDGVQEEAAVAAV